MGVRGEIFSSKVILPNRTYFFNVKENRMGDLYLNIVESKNKETGGFERQSVIVFEADSQEFLKGFEESLHVMEKAVKEKRREKGAKAKSSESSEGKFERFGAKKRGERDGERNGKTRSSSFRDTGKPAGKTDRPRERSQGGGQTRSFDRKGERSQKNGQFRGFEWEDKKNDREHRGSRTGGKRLVVRKR